MLEGAPKEITEKDVFKALRRKLGPYVNLDQRYDSDFKASATNTAAAYNLISEHIDNGRVFLAPGLTWALMHKLTLL